MTGIAPFEVALLGLLSLLLAFTFNRSSAYYDTRRSLLLQEATSIGTALMRADYFTDSVRSDFRKDFKAYITDRIRYYETGSDEQKIQDAAHQSHVIGRKIWSRAASIAHESGDAKSLQMTSAVNDMIDAATLREEARIEHVPDMILLLLFTLCVAGSFVVGYANKTKKADWVILLSYSLMTVMTVYVILDLNQPHKGLINTDKTQYYMYHLLQTF